MASDIARFINLLLAAILAGNEVGTWSVVHPAIKTLPSAAEVEAEQALTRGYGAKMPALMTSTLASCWPVLFLDRDRRSPSFLCTLAAALCFSGMLAITLLGNVPINRQVLQVSSRAPGTEWRRLRDRWERLHTLRVLLDLAGLSFLYVGTLSRSKRNAAPGREVVG